MRPGALLSLMCATIVACRAVEPVRELTVREVRLVTLDSLAERTVCDTTRFALLYDRAAWRPAHACALAHRSLAMLAAAPAQEPYFAPGDTARVRAVAVVRQQPCMLRMVDDKIVGGTMSPLLYVIAIEAHDRAHSIVVGIDAERLTGHVEHDVHPRGTMGPFAHLTVPTWNSTDSLANGAPCPSLEDEE